MSTRLLLVEDDEAVVTVTKRRLEHEGFQVLVARDGEEVFNVLDREGAVDLILLDIKLPKLDGYGVCQRLKMDKKQAQMKVVLFTASETKQRELTNRCIELGVDGWIKKPFATKELLSTIYRVVGTERK